MRKMISDLLQPTIKRSKEDKLAIQELKSIIQILQKELSEVKYQGEKTDEKTLTFDEVFQRMNELVTILYIYIYIFIGE